MLFILFLLSVLLMIAWKSNRYAKPPGAAAGTDHDGNELFTMQKVLDMKFLHGKKYYLIEWAGYESESTWEPALSIMKDAASQKVIQDFLKSYQPPRSGSARAARQRLKQ